MTAHWTDRLSAYLDGELTPGERDACEEHLLGCPECREVLGELRVIVAEARALEDGEPALDLWPGIRARLGGSMARLSDRPTTPRRVLAFSLPQLLAAGLAFAVVGAGGAVALGALGGTSDGAGMPVIAPAPVVQPAVAVPGGAAWDQAVTELRAVLDAGRGRLDPRTVRVLEQSLATIDRALARSREALASDPANPYLNAHLQETMRRKIELLRHAAGLVASES
jgi:anti-sigma factor RsiW